MADYLLAGQESELERLSLQSRVWEPAGERLLARLGGGSGLRALDVGCGVLGWLRLLSGWADEVVGADIDEAMLAHARALDLPDVELVADDLFASELEPASFDLVHARFQLAPLGREDEQLAAYARLLRPGGVLVLEDPDSASWGYHPGAPALAALVDLIRRGFRAAGGDFDAGGRLPDHLRTLGIEPELDAHVVALPPGHPYLRLPLQFAASLRPRLLELVAASELDRLLEGAAAELEERHRWGLTFTLVQAWGAAAGA
jgi:SAM-dependent methyltransferase